MIYLTSDEHHGHKNIIHHCHRPFKSVEEMDNILIENFNKKVTKNDLTYHLGDFCFRSANNKGNGELIKAKEYIKQLNGEHIFIEGNHDFDGKNSLKTRNKEIILRIAKMHVQLIHDPDDANVEYDLILCGHVHNNWKVKEIHYRRKKRLIINIGVDVWNFYPVEWREIQTISDRWKAGHSIESLNK